MCESTTLRPGGRGSHLAGSLSVWRLIRPHRMLLAATMVSAACDGDGAVAPSDPRVPTALVSVSGSGLQGKAGEVLPAEFIVRAIDKDGMGVRDVTISWRVTSGRGRFRDGNRSMEVAHGSTDSQGRARIRFQPLVLGHSTVEARTSTRPERSTTFTTEATSTVIHIWLWMAGPGGSSDTAVPVGSHVEWLNWLTVAQVASTSKPSNGSSFRSDRLGRGERFEFVPDAAGTWEFVDEISGIRGTLTAR